MTVFLMGVIAGVLITALTWKLLMMWVAYSTRIERCCASHLGPASHGDCCHGDKLHSHGVV
jgi:hypothetical protein